MQTCQYCHTENRDDAVYCNHCGGTLAAGGAGSPSISSAATSPAQPPPSRNATGRLPPQAQLRGRYLILKLLGQGGMAAD